MFKLQILSDGKVKCCIHQHSCLYDKKTFEDMGKCGFKFKLNGKAISVSNLCKELKIK